jgi:CDP-diacylglycerol--serine O-phosphatidyltransferase
MIKRYFPVLAYFNLPNAITLTGLVMGMVNIYLIMTGQFRLYYLLHYIISVMDSLDGFIAKKLNRITELGSELDSLCDAINFALVPALFAIGLCGFSLPIAFGSAVYVTCGILRLGYYNITSEGKDTDGFIGVPTTIATMFSMVFTWFFGYLVPSLSFLVMPALLLMALLMIARFRTPGTNFARGLFVLIGFVFLILALVLRR